MLEADAGTTEKRHIVPTGLSRWTLRYRITAITVGRIFSSGAAHLPRCTTARVGALIAAILSKLFTDRRLPSRIRLGERITHFGA